jgi:Gamma-glutamyltransferase
MQQSKPIRPVIPSWSALAAWLCIAALCLPASLAARQASDTVAPQTTHTLKSQTLVTAKQFMVSTAHPDATQAGYAILKAGGSAVDAAIAVQLVLGLVEPQASGLGGGALMVLWDADKQQLVALDGRETAPQAVTPDLFLDELGEPLQFMDAVVGGRSVGTPGTVALLAHAHANYGKLPWQDLFTAARQLATDGFVVTAHMAEQIADSADSLRTFPATQQYFSPQMASPCPSDLCAKTQNTPRRWMSSPNKARKAFTKARLPKPLSIP